MNLENIWFEIKNMYDSVRVGTSNEVESYIYKGIKIKKVLSKITILNTKKRGDHYQEITAEQYEAFMSYGAKYGAYQVMTDNYQDSLDKIQTKIQNEINIRNNMKHFIALKEMRTTLIQKYVDANKIKQELLT